MIIKKTKKDPAGKALRKKNLTGFTLVEVLIVIALIGLLGAIGYPSLIKWVPNYQLKAASRAMYADFQRAKLHAVKTNKDVTFTISISPTCNTTTGYTFTDLDGTVVASKTMENGVCISESNFTNGSSGFDPRGLPTILVGGTIKLKHTKIPREYDIIQNSAGRIRLI